MSPHSTIHHCQKSISDTIGTCLFSAGIAHVFNQPLKTQRCSPEVDGCAQDGSKRTGGTYAGNGEHGPLRCEVKGWRWQDGVNGSLWALMVGLLGFFSCRSKGTVEVLVVVTCESAETHISSFSFTLYSEMISKSRYSQYRLGWTTRSRFDWLARSSYSLLVNRVVLRGKCVFYYIINVAGRAS